MDPIILPILIHSDNTLMLKDLGVDFRYEDLSENEFCFFKIDFACRSFKNGKEYTEINVGENSFIANVTFDEFINVINE